MRIRHSLPILTMSAVVCAQTVRLIYPVAARGDHVDVYHGVKVADPYRWMEDIDAPQTRAWIRAENRLSADYLAGIPGRAAIAQRLARVWNYERWSAPERHGAYWFFTHNDGLQNQAAMMVSPDPDTAAHVLLDPNTLSSDGTIALREQAVSQDGRFLAYALSEAGSDWQTWRVRDVATGRDLPDLLRWSKAGGGSWRADDSGFYYTAYEQPKPGESLKASNQFQKLYFHRLGTPQSKDQLIYGRSDAPDWFVAGTVTDDGRYLLIEAQHGDAVQNTLLVQDLRSPRATIEAVIAQPNASYSVVGNVGSTLYVLTNADAPRYRVVAIDLSAPEPVHWNTVVAEGADILDDVSLVGDQLLAQYLHDAHSVVHRYGLDGTLLGDVPLSGLGSASGFQGHRDDRSTYYSYSSFTTPPSVYRLDLQSGAVSLWREPQLAGFDAAQYDTSLEFAVSRDGTRVPVFVVASKDAKRDGMNPTILYGYGGFNVSLEPAFSPAVAAWLQSGGVYALAILRGGGEYGRAWHEAGMKTLKQHVFDDFIGAAEHLIARRWTSPQRLAIRGRSNGGLLIGATLEQRPELFAAAIPQVGVMDMLRFRDFTVGKGWESDYGSVDNPEEFRALLAYSPLQNVKAGVDYPAILATTADHDDRVFPAHSFKFIAALQHADPHGRPILIRIETRAGHGQGEPTDKLIAENADVYAFIRQAMQLPP
jgi:prolyl oligopeptidase